MVSVKNAKKGKKSVKREKSIKNYCFDCKKEIKIENKEIKNGLKLLYESEGEKFEIFKCNQCFKKNPSLKNYRDCEVYSRVVGYLRPVSQWNFGKQREFKERKEYKKLKLRTK